MKVLSLLFVIFFIFGGTSCRKEIPVDTSMEYKPETDHRFYTNTLGQSQIAEVSDGYYYMQDDEVAGSYLRYVDKENFEDTIVCSKPNCLHQNQDDPTECNARFENHQGIHYYKGKLYVITAEADPVNLTNAYRFIEVSLDGTQRRKVWDMEWAESATLPHVFANIVHRGKLYFTVFGFDTFPNSPMQLYAYDLNTRKCTLIEDELTSVTRLFAFGDYLYAEAYCDEINDYMCYRYTISTGKRILLPNTEGLIVFKTGIYHKQFFTHHYYVSDIKGENPVKIEMPIDFLCTANDKYLCVQKRTIKYKETGQTVPLQEFYDIADDYREDMTEDEYVEYQKELAKYDVIWDDYLEVYDAKTFELLGTMEYSDEWINCFYLDGDYMIRYLQGSAELSRLDLSKIGTEDFLWEISSRVN